MTKNIFKGGSVKRIPKVPRADPFKADLLEMEFTPWNQSYEFGISSGSPVKKKSQEEEFGIYNYNAKTVVDSSVFRILYLKKNALRY
jgi:hypothetical protein